MRITDREAKFKELKEQSVAENIKMRNKRIC